MEHKPTSLPLNLRISEYRSVFLTDVMSIKIFVHDTADSDRIVMTATLEQMAGCNGAVISRGVWIDEAYRGKGYGCLFNAYREELATANGWGVMLCSVRAGNTPQEAILKRRGYSIFNQFINPKTGNEVTLYFKNLKFKNYGKEFA